MIYTNGVIESIVGGIIGVADKFDIRVTLVPPFEGALLSIGGIFIFFCTTTIICATIIL